MSATVTFTLAKPHTMNGSHAVTLNTYSTGSSSVRLKLRVNRPESESKTKRPSPLLVSMKYSTSSPSTSVAEMNPTVVPATPCSSTENVYTSSVNSGLLSLILPTATLTCVVPVSGGVPPSTASTGKL